MSLSLLEIAELKPDFSQAEECLIVPLIMTETLLISLEGLIIVLLDVLYLTKNEVEERAKLLYVLPESHQITPLGLVLVFEDQEASLTKFSSQLILTLDEVMLCKVARAESVPGIGLEASLEVLHGVLSHLEVID